MPACNEKRIGEKFFNELILNIPELVKDDKSERFSYTDMTYHLAASFRDGSIEPSMLKDVRQILINSAFDDLVLDPVQKDSYTMNQLTMISGIIADNILARAEVLSEMMSDD